MPYKELRTRIEIEQAYLDSLKANNKEVPKRQFEEAVKPALEAPSLLQIPPFRTFIQAIDDLNLPYTPDIKILEVGASSGYYGEVLRRSGIDWNYTALDYNQYYKDLAKELYPNQEFIVADALSLPFKSQSFDIVVLGGCLLHILDWPRVLVEAARVSKQYVIIHRQPLLFSSETRYFSKEAYGAPMFEIWLNRNEFEEQLDDTALEMISLLTIFEQMTEYGFMGHFTVTCRRKDYGI